MVKPETSKQAERSTSDESKYKGRERIWLGSYKSAEKAARAFDAALFCLRGPSAKFNFPENPPDIAGGRSLTPAEIQVAAARFANAEPQTSRSRRSSSSSSSSSSSEMQVESPSPSVSDGVAPMGTETPLDGSFLDLFATMGSENTGPGSFDIFPGFDDFSNEFFVPPLPQCGLWRGEL
ncbi:integrase-type DNA-binding superfamily protein [Actinidia rufa]|uniref:Integrase-type DNA-binding superfamily protein n=1 Tax=Actinidia rufa TaxID=165716 RepID=A0A7J0FIL0_9ERIC|nr:integrase-type DNA-binding superfamily protein [Actinidia rufa]